MLTAGNLFTGRCFGGSAYGVREELNLPNNSKGVECLRVFQKRRRRHKKLSSALSAH